MVHAEGRAARIEPRALTEGAWRPYGWLPLPDTDPRDGEHRLHYEWADPHVNVIGHTLDEVPAVEGGLRCEKLYHHSTHTQVLMPLDHPCVVVVAAPDAVLEGPGDVANIEAFLLEPLQSLVLHRATWHWGPYPTRTDSVRLFNVQGLRYAEDNDMLDLAARGVAVEVHTG